MQKIEAHRIKIATCFLIMLLASFIFIPTSAYAADNPQITISANTNSAKPGDVITYSLDLTNNQNIMGTDIYIDYDNSKIELVENDSDTVKKENIYDNNISNINVTDAGRIHIVIVSNKDKLDDGNILTADFKIKKDATGDIKLKAYNCESCDQNADLVKTDVINNSDISITQKSNNDPIITPTAKDNSAKANNVNKEVNAIQNNSSTNNIDNKISKEKNVNSVKTTDFNSTIIWTAVLIFAVIVLSSRLKNKSRKKITATSIIFAITLSLLSIDSVLAANVTPVNTANPEYYLFEGRYTEKIAFDKDNSIDQNKPITIDVANGHQADKIIILNYDNKEFKLHGTSLNSNGTYSISTDNGNDLYAVYGINGDINGDNSVNKNDLNKTLDYLCGAIDFNTIEQGFADVNIDNKINIQDLVRIALYVTGRTSSVYTPSTSDIPSTPDTPSTPDAPSTPDTPSTPDSSDSDSQDPSYDGGGSGTGGTISPDYASGGGKNPSGTTGISGSDVVEYAKQFVGNPYVWGGNSLTNGIDCSGFVHEVYAHFGISTPRYSQSFKSVGQAVSFDNIQPGDVVVYPGQVAIYAGDGVIVEAQSTKAGITANRSVNCHTILAIRRLV